MSLSTLSSFSDVPQDLSAKVKSVSVQTDSSHDTILRDLLTGFTDKQIRVLLNVLSQLLWKNNQEIPESAESYATPGLQRRVINNTPNDLAEFQVESVAALSPQQN